MEENKNVNEVEEVKEEVEVEQEETSSSLNPSFTIREMLEAGVHFGHRTARWNAKMLPYIYTVKNELHIIDLTQTVILFKEAIKILQEIVRRNGKILFVCTKKQGSEIVKNVAKECQQYYVTNKWLGGMLTNWKTIARSIKTLRDIEKELENENSTLTKKEKLLLSRKKEKLEGNLGGIKDMTKLPDLVFVIDTPRESLAIAEARSLNIPIMAIVDTNSNPDLVDYPIPGNDDSIKAIDLYMRVINEALQDISKNVSEQKELSKKNNNQKVASKKASKKINKRGNSSPKKEKEKLPATKKEHNTPMVKKEEKVPTVKEEAKTPAVTE